MKNKINLRCLILLVIGITSISACKKDSNIMNSNKEKLSAAVVIENGYLRFRDQKAFDSLVNILLKANGTRSLAINNSEGFISYKDVYTNIEKEYFNVNDDLSFKKFQKTYGDLVEVKTDSSMFYKFGTPLSALFTNVKGEVMIGNMMTVYTKRGKMISYVGPKKTESELQNIDKTDSSKNIFVQNISNKHLLLAGNPVNGTTTTSTIKSELYYNEDSKRRLFVDLWLDYTPRTDSETNSPTVPISRYYFTSRQELKRTFGGWRTNETDYNFSNLNYNYGMYRIPEANPRMYNFTLPSYTVANVTGPIIIDLGAKEGQGTGISGTGRFFSGGVPNAPSFNVN